MNDGSYFFVLCIELQFGMFFGHGFPKEPTQGDRSGFLSRIRSLSIAGFCDEDLNRDTSIVMHLIIGLYLRKTRRQQQRLLYINMNNWARHRQTALIMHPVSFPLDATRRLSSSSYISASCRVAWCRAARSLGGCLLRPFDLNANQN